MENIYLVVYKQFEYLNEILHEYCKTNLDTNIEHAKLFPKKHLTQFHLKSNYFNASHNNVTIQRTNMR